MVTLGSFNKYNRDFFKDCGYITFANSFASLYGGCVIFAVLGYMSHVTGIPVEKVADSGPGLIFIVYPKAISLMPFPHFWAILFFFMLIVVAIDSVFVQAEGEYNKNQNSGAACGNGVVTFPYSSDHFHDGRTASPPPDTLRKGALLRFHLLHLVPLGTAHGDRGVL